MSQGFRGAEKLYAAGFSLMNEGGRVGESPLRVGEVSSLNPRFYILSCDKLIPISRLIKLSHFPLRDLSLIVFM